VRLPYNLSTPSQKLATIVLRDLWNDVVTVVDSVKSERARVARALDERGVEVTPSQANFLWFKTPRPAGDVFRELGARGVLVRSFHAVGGRLGGQIRATIGTPSENDELIGCLGEIL
jgi:histidinol-phosphate aminotransferase